MKRISQLPQRTRFCTPHWRQVCQVQQSLEVNKKPMRKIVGAMLSARVWTPCWDGLLGHPTRNCQNGVIFKEGWKFLGHGLKVQTARFGFQVLYFCLQEIGLDSAWTLFSRDLNKLELPLQTSGKIRWARRETISRCHFGSVGCRDLTVERGEDCRNHQIRNVLNHDQKHAYTVDTMDCYSRCKNESFFPFQGLILFCSWVWTWHHRNCTITI